MSASAFDQQLLRLKSAMGVTEDQDVAQALGLSKAALSDRKKRGRFPEDKLWALAQRQPELGIDPVWVLTGKAKGAFQTSMAVVSAQARAVLESNAQRLAGLSAGDQLAYALEVVQKAQLSEDELELIRLYRELTPADQKRLLTVVNDFAERRGSREKTSGATHMHNKGPGGIQVAHVSGKVTVKGSR